MAENHITRELKIKKNDITVLLGHDGAGKTALLKMIYGKFKLILKSLYLNRNH